MKKLRKSLFSNIFIIIFVFLPTYNCFGMNQEKGRKLFNENCISCHKQGTNLIIPEKNLKKLILEANGMYNQDAIVYQILNGKNGMPAFGGRINESEIEEIANYVLFASEKNFDF
jgi:cytochrome c6